MTDEPRFGRRSPEWRPDSRPSEGPSELHTQSGSPWSTMGELHTDNVYAPPAYSGPSGEAAPAWEDDERAAARQARREAAAQGPGGAPADPWVVSDQQRLRAREEQRRSGRRLIIWGLVASFLLAPIFAIGYVIVATDLIGLANRLQSVSSGQTVTVDESGGYFVIDLASAGIASCSLSDGAGKASKMEPIPSSQPALWIADLRPGDYTITCEANANASMMGATGLDPNKAISSSTWGVGISTFIGFTGIALTIAGVRRNSRAKRL